MVEDRAAARTAGGVPAYDLVLPARICFGWGRRTELGALARPLGSRAFLVTGSRTLEANGSVGELVESLERAGVAVVAAGRVVHEPEPADIDGLAARLREGGAGDGDLVVAVGGGAAIDAGKAAALLAVQKVAAPVTDYLEGVGKGLRALTPPLPVVAVPTTAGTGSEATKNAVISSYDPPFKKSLRSDRMMPRVALVDPELTVSVPPETTAWTGMDAMTQLIESYISRRARPVTRALALEGLRLAARSLPVAFRDGSSRSAREAMAHASCLSGIALANSGLGLAHGVAAALGALCRVPHGLACAALLPAALRTARAVREDDLGTLAEVFTARAAADAVIAGVEGLARELGIPPRLRDLGVREDQILALVDASRGNSMSASPYEPPDDELEELLRRLW